MKSEPYDEGVRGGTTALGSTISPPPLNVNAGANLCASCDRCRLRKTKCDGNRPCSNCVVKYLKKFKVEGNDKVPAEELKNVQCIYSTAKRRGPVPGATKVQPQMHPSSSCGTTRKADLMYTKIEPNYESAMGNGSSSQYLMGQGTSADFGISRAATGGSAGNTTADLWMQNRNLDEIARLGSLGAGQMAGLQGVGVYNSLVQNGLANEEVLNLLQRQQQMIYGANAHRSVMGMGLGIGNNALNSASAASVPAAAAVQLQLNYFQQLQAAHQLQAAQQLQATQQQLQHTGQEPEEKASANLKYLQHHLQAQSIAADEEIRRLRARVEKLPDAEASLVKISDPHLRLLSKSSLEGNRLRSYYELSVNELLNLPPIPSDEDYCRRLPVPLESPKFLPRFDLAALNSARFAELALGAFVSNQVGLSLELSNATVTCLRECVEEPIHPLCIFDVARAYFLHGFLLSVKGDMERYFKYRRVCLRHLNQVGNISGVQELLAAISFHDSWAYILHNAEIDALPKIDNFIPPVPISEKLSSELKVQQKYGITNTESQSIVTNPDNQMWIQGPPPIFTNNEAPALARSLDALACSVRSCCDQANQQFEKMAKLMIDESQDAGLDSAGFPICSTRLAVMAREGDLCNRNLVLSAATLLRQYENSNNNSTGRRGHRMAIHLMDAFLVNTGDENGGFSGEQIKNLLSACTIVVEHPLLLYQPGPMYHMVTNAAVLLCHLLNGLYSNLPSGSSGGIEVHLFDEVLDTFISVRNLLDCHRKKLPVRLRCHGIPRPNLSLLNVKKSDPDTPFIDLGKTFMCFCRGCQGFVLVACSPCVAAEKAQAARLKQQAALHGEAQGRNKEDVSSNDLDKELDVLGIELNLDDDALLGVLSRIISM